MAKRILDLFCGAGGAAVGLHRAGFEVVGVDIEPQPNYPFEFHQADALEYLLGGFDAYWASPPCQYATRARRNEGKRGLPRLIPLTRDRLVLTGKPFIIENVDCAFRDMKAVIMLCGTMFGLRIFRHRLFEANFLIPNLSHSKHKGHVYTGEYVSVCEAVSSQPSHNKKTEVWAEAMGIYWMTRQELTQAVPPVYAQFLGSHLMAFLVGRK